MIVARSDKGQMLIGLTEEDIEVMRKGLTKTKEGGPDYGFRSLIVFMGPSDEEMIKTLSSAATVRKDDMFPKAGSG